MPPVQPPARLLERTELELLWKEENEDKLIVALANKEYLDAYRLLKRIENDMGSHSQSVSFSDPSWYLANLDYRRAKHVKDFVDSYVEEKAVAELLDQPIDWTPTPSPTSFATLQATSTATGGRSACPLPSSSVLAPPFTQKNPGAFPATPKKPPQSVGASNSNLGTPASLPATPKKPSQQPGSIPSTPKTPYSANEKLGSPFPNRRHYCVTCGYRVGVYSSWWVVHTQIYKLLMNCFLTSLLRSQVAPLIDGIRKQAVWQAFDIYEEALTDYLLAREKGTIRVIRPNDDVTEFGDPETAEDI